MSDPAKVPNVRHELTLLEKTWKDSGAVAVNLGTAEADLTQVNEKLWVIERRDPRRRTRQALHGKIHRAGARRVLHQRRTRSDQEARQHLAGLDHRRREVLQAVLT
jgi:Tfp pilus assembly protein PilO